MIDETIRESLIRQIQLPPLPDTVVYLSEAKFRKTWLPMFLNYFAGTDGGVVSMWATNVAGNFYRPVHVVQNENSPGELLFTVPPLMNYEHKVYSDDTVAQIPLIMASASKHNSVMPGSGDTYIINNLVQKAAPSQTKSDEEDAWKKIYRYYDIDAPFMNVKVSDTSGREQIESLIEGFDDDF